MPFRFEIADDVLEQLRAMPKEVRQAIGYRLDLLQQTFAGDVKKLKGSVNEYRLRIGSHRVLFTLEDDLIFVYAVRDRKDVYD